jgi:hypothetical protein
MSHSSRSEARCRAMATLAPVRVVYCTVCGLPPEFCEYNTEVPHPAGAQDAPAASSGGGGAAQAQQALAALSLAGGGGAAAGAEPVRDGWRAVLPAPLRADASRARLPRLGAAQKAQTRTRPRRARRAARSLPRNRCVAAAAAPACPGRRRPDIGACPGGACSWLTRSRSSCLSSAPHATSASVSRPS